MPEEKLTKTCRRCKEEKYPFEVVFSDQTLCKQCQRNSRGKREEEILSANDLTKCDWSHVCHIKRGKRKWK